MPDQNLDHSARAALRGGSVLLWIAFGLSLVVSILHLAGPLFIILIYDRVLTSRSQETLFALLIMVAVLIVTLGLLDYSRKRIVARFAAQFQERLEHTILRAAERSAVFPPRTTQPSGGLDEVDYLRGFFHSGGLLTVMDFVWTPMFVAVLFLLHPVIGYLTLAGLLVQIALVCIQLAFVGGREDRNNTSAQRINDLKDIVLTSREILHSQKMAPGFKARWLEARERGRDDAIALRDWTAWFDQMTNVVMMLVRYGVLAAGAWLVLNNQLSVGAMVAAAFLVSRALVPVNSFIGTIPAIFRALNTWKSLRKTLLKWESSTHEAFTTRPANANLRLAVQRVSLKSPLTDAITIQQLSLTVEAGTVTEIIGQSGQGKTAIAEALMGIGQRVSGTILIDGTHIDRMSDADMATAIGYVPETPRFFPGTIAENISRMDPDMTSAKIEEAARKSCLHARLSALSKGYQTEIDAAASILPRGERQQLSLARALYQTPKILLIDEMDTIMLERLPETMAKTLHSVTNRGGAIIFLARKPIDLNMERFQYFIENGILSKPRKIIGGATNGGQSQPMQASGKVAVIGGDAKLGRAAQND